MKKALVTGSAGFIGRHFVQKLENDGWDVFDIDLAERPGYSSDVLYYFNEYDKVFDLVVHCAYHVGGRSGIDGVNLNFPKNIQVDAAMVEWAVRTKQKRVLYFSSSAAYPIQLQGKPASPYRLRERDLNLDLEGREGAVGEPLDLGPDKEYGWAKLTGERLARDARRNGLAVTVVRPFSGYGEDQSLDYPFPSIVRRAQAGELMVWGPPGQCRDWIHIDDVVEGSLAVVESETEDPVNICTGVATEMGDLMRLAYKTAHGVTPEEASDGFATVIYDESKPTGVFYRVGDSTRFNQYYTPKISLEEGIRRALQ